MKLSIIGAGRVGSSTAFLALSRLKLNELVLVDLQEDFVKGEALDLAHAAVVLSPNTKVTGTSDSSEIQGSDFVIITAGKPRKAGQTRDELAETNRPIIKSICENIQKIAPKATVLVVTNPSTQMAQIAKEYCKNRVIAMDTQLDTARLRFYISHETGTPITQIKSRTFGEHGENMQFDIREKLTSKQADRVKQSTKKAGAEIICAKGCTCWGIASAIIEEINSKT